MKVIFIILLIGMLIAMGAATAAVLLADYEKYRKQIKKKCYLCDPNKHTRCKKSSCQELCFDTTYKEFAVLDTDGNPIVTYDPEKERHIHESQL